MYILDLGAFIRSTEKGPDTFEQLSFLQSTFIIYPENIWLKHGSKGVGATNFTGVIVGIGQVHKEDMEYTKS